MSFKLFLYFIHFITFIYLNSHWRNLFSNEACVFHLFLLASLFSNGARTARHASTCTKLIPDWLIQLPSSCIVPHEDSIVDFRAPEPPYLPETSWHFPKQSEWIGNPPSHFYPIVQEAACACACSLFPSSFTTLLLLLAFNRASTQTAPVFSFFLFFKSALP